MHSKCCFAKLDVNKHYKRYVIIRPQYLVFLPQERLVTTQYPWVLAA